MTKNGTVKTIVSIVVVALALGGIIWGFSKQSERLTVCGENVTALQTAVVQVKESVTEIDKSVALIQNNFEHMQEDVADILTMQKKMLRIPE